MPARKPQRPRPRPAAIPANGEVKIGDVPRQLADLAAAVRALEARLQDRKSSVVDLAVGVNRINHGLGRIPVGANVTPSTADATWAWAVTDRSAAQIEITTVGVAQTAAILEVF